MPSKAIAKEWKAAKQNIIAYRNVAIKTNLKQFALLHNRTPKPDYLEAIKRAMDSLIPAFASMGRAVQAIRPAITVKQREKLRKLITACGPRFSVYQPGRSIVDGGAITELQNFVWDLSLPVEDKSESKERPSKQATALALLADHPDWSYKQIASAAGVHVKTLSSKRWQSFRTARKISRTGKADLMRGYKDPKTGEIEAWDNDDLA